MAPAVTRKITIDYGGVKIGGTTDRQPHEKIVTSIDYDQLVFEITFVITAGMQADIAVVEAAFRKPRQALSITFDGSTRTYSAAAGTGYDIRASLSKVGNERDTRTTRMYVFRAEVKLPADLTGQDGRKEAEEDYTVNENRRGTLILTGIWTQVSGTASAISNYATERVAYAAAAITRNAGAGVTFELVTNRWVVNDEDTELRYELRYEQILATQDTGTLDHATIIQPSTLIARVETGSDDAPVGATIRKPVQAQVTYSVWLDFTVTSDPFTFWTSTSRPALIELARALLGASTFAMIDDSPQIDHDQNRINGSLTLEAYFASGPAKAVAFAVEVELENQTGNVVIETWDKQKIYSAEVEPGPGKMFLVATETLTRIGMVGDLFSMAFSRAGFEDSTMFGFGQLKRPASLIAGADSRWVLLAEKERQKPRRRGIEPYTVDLLDMIRETRFRRADTPSTGGGGFNEETTFAGETTTSRTG